MDYRPNPFVSVRRRRRWPAAAGRAAVVVVVVAAGGALIAGPSERPTPEPDSLASLTARAADDRREPPFPSGASLRAARRFAADRSGTVSFAVIDDRGRLRGLNAHRGYPSASMTKAMLLVAYLTELDESKTPLDDSDRAPLDPMIRHSDNAAATQVQGLLTSDALEELAARAGMSQFDYFGDWANASITAADQARFFLRVDRLTPRPYRDYARELLGGITAEHSWGIPAAATEPWSVFFKGGWRPTNSGELVHQAALLESRGRRIAVAVLSDANPTHDYGTGTVRGIAARLLSPRRPALPEAALAAGRL